MNLTSAHPNAARLAEAYGDMRKFTDLMTDDVVVHSQGSRGIAAGDWVGKADVVQRMADLWERSGESYVMTPTAIAASDAFACVMARLTAAHPTEGRTMDVQICGVWRFDTDGRLVEHWENVDDWSAFDDFFEPLEHV